MSIQRYYVDGYEYELWKEDEFYAGDLVKYEDHLARMAKKDADIERITKVAESRLIDKDLITRYASMVSSMEAEIERYKRALEWMSNSEYHMSLTDGVFGIWRNYYDEHACNPAVGKGTTALEAIENAMGENK